jgi:hypothetical protein
VLFELDTPGQWDQVEKTSAGTLYS